MADDSDRIRRAVELLAAEARERIRRHPLGHLAASESLQLALTVPATLLDGQLSQLCRRASADLDLALQGVLDRLRIFRPGRVYCLFCRSADCVHARPRSATEVFSGYGPTGQPRFVSWPQRLIEQRDPRVDLLYREPPHLVVRVAPAAELIATMLPPFRDNDEGFRLHGQVEAGLFHARDADGVPQPLAVSLQVVSVRGATDRRGRPARRFGLNVVGIAPGGQPLEALHDRLREIPWAPAAAWAQEALAGVEIQAARPLPTGHDPAELLARRLAGILAGVARRLEKGGRGRERRTLHGQERHAARERPTWKAMADLASAGASDVLLDTRRGTLVVLGERGRAHVFNPAGKLVTSVRYSTASIEKKRALGLWRPALPGEVEELRKLAGELAAVED